MNAGAPELASSFACLVVVAIVGGLIALAVSLIRKSSEEAKQAEYAINQMVQRLPQDRQMMFVMQYNAARKNPTTAVLLALFLGGIGVHKFYLGQAGWGIAYLLLCWTYVPALIALVEAFSIAGYVGKYNQQKSMEIAAMLGASNPAMFVR